MDEHDTARADGGTARPVIDDVFLGLEPELPDAQINDLGMLPDERTPDKACAADDQHPPVRRPVVHQRRPGLAALVRGYLDRRDDRLADDARKAVGRAVFGLDQGDVVCAERYRLTRCDDSKPVV